MKNRGKRRIEYSIPIIVSNIQSPHRQGGQRNNPRGCQIDTREQNQKESKTSKSKSTLSASLAKFFRPIFIFPESVVGYTRPNGIQTCLEVLEGNGADLVHRCV